MYTRVNGRIALYFLSVSDTADFSGSSLTLPFTFDLPVAVFLLVLDDVCDDELLYSDAVRPPFFFPREDDAPPRNFNIVLNMFLLVLLTLIGESPAVVCRVDDDVNVIRRGWNDGIFASTNVAVMPMQ